MQLPKSLGSITRTAAGFAPSAWARSLPLWVSGGLVLLLAWQAVQLTWTALGSRGVPPPTDAGPMPAVQRPAAPAVNIGRIVGAHLFGEAGAAGSQETDPTAVAATQMNLVLAGTIAHADPQQGFAIVGESAAAAALRRVTESKRRSRTTSHDSRRASASLRRAACRASSTRAARSW